MNLIEDNLQPLTNKNPVKFRVTPEILNEVQILAGRGLTINQISDYYGISNKTFHLHKKNNPELEVAFRKGKCKTISFVAGKLIEHIKNDNIPATIFYLKTQGGWTDASTVQLNEPIEHSELTINVNDPIEAAKVYQQIMRRGK